MVKRANHPSAGMNLDIGNLRPPKVYEQIDSAIPYAINTHIKPTVALDDGKTRGPFDFDRVFGMFAKHGFRGYMGLEYESEDAPAEIPRFLRILKDMGAKYSG